MSETATVFHRKYRCLANSNTAGSNGRILTQVCPSPTRATATSRPTTCQKYQTKGSTIPSPIAARLAPRRLPARRKGKDALAEPNRLDIKPQAAQTSRANNRAVGIEATGRQAMNGRITGVAKGHWHPASLEPCIFQIMLDTLPPEVAGHPRGSESSSSCKKIGAVAISYVLLRPRWPEPSKSGRRPACPDPVRSNVRLFGPVRGAEWEEKLPA